MSYRINYKISQETDTDSNARFQKLAWVENLCWTKKIFSSLLTLKTFEDYDKYVDI